MDGEEMTAADAEGGATWHDSGVHRHLRDRDVVLHRAAVLGSGGSR
jgi:hypothetical protein